MMWLDRKSLMLVDCDTLPLGRALKQSDIRINCDSRNQPTILYFQNKGAFSKYKKDLRASTLVGLT